MFNTAKIGQTVNSMAATSATAPSNQLGKDDFLKLLITQMQHQDPLSPLKNEEYIAQLAQFSSLEQMQNINDNLKTSVQSDLLMAQSISNSMITSLIGKDAKVQTDTFAVSQNQGTDIGFMADQPYSSATLTIYDQNGSVVYNKDLGNAVTGENNFTWDGRDSRGNIVDSGNYRVEVKLANEDEDENTATTFLNGEIRSVKYHSGGASLQIGDQLFNVSDILEVSKP